MSVLGSIIIGAGTSAAVYMTGAQVYAEYLFPAVFVYHIITFTLTYPEATLIRKLIITFLLSFADLFVTAAIFQIQLPRKLWLWVLEYAIIHYMVRQMTIDEIKQLLSHELVRLPIFILPGYIKSLSLLSTLCILTCEYDLKNLKGFVVLLVAGVLKMTSTIGVYYLDKLSLGGRFDRLSVDEIWNKFKVYVFGVCIAVEVCAYYERPIKEFNWSKSGNLIESYMFGYNLSQSYLVPGIFFAGVYAYQSYNYGKILKERIEE